MKALKLLIRYRSSCDKRNLFMSVLLVNVPWCSWFWMPVWGRFFIFCLPCKPICVYQNVPCSILHFLLWAVLKDSSHLATSSVEKVVPVQFKMWMWLWKPEWQLGPQDGTLKMNFGAALWRKDCTMWWTCRKTTLWSHWGLEATCCTLYFLFINHDLILSVMP